MVTTAEILEQAQAGDFSNVGEWLAEHSGDVNETDGKNWTVLHWLAQAEADGKPVDGVAELLLEAGADPHQGDKENGTAGDTPFNVAAPNSPETGRLMTNHWLEMALRGDGEKGLNDTTGSHGSTLAQYIAKWSNDDEIEGQIERAVAKGMVINRANASGWTPLSAAAAMGRAKAVEAFAEHYDLGAMNELTTEPYTATYGEYRVTFPEGANAKGLAQARLDQDKGKSEAMRLGLERCKSAIDRRIQELSDGMDGVSGGLGAG